MRYLTIAADPLLAAYMSAVQPSPSGMFISGYNSTKYNRAYTVKRMDNPWIGQS